MAGQRTKEGTKSMFMFSANRESATALAAAFITAMLCVSSATSLIA